MSPTQTQPTYYHPTTTTHHEWRTVSNSAQHLLPILLEKAAVNPKLSLLDVGAGSGTITAGLAAAIPHGRAVAFDLSADILVKAAKHAESVGVENLEVQQGDVYQLPFPNGSFDVVHASMILAHLARPGEAVREMIRVARNPGGVIALRESDLRAWSVWPEYPGLMALNKVQCRLLQMKGGTVNAGARLVGWVLEAGVERGKISAGAGTWCYSSREEREMWGGVMSSKGQARPVGGERAVVEGLVSEEELEGIRRDWERWAEVDGAWFGCLHGEVVVRL